MIDLLKEKTVETVYIIEPYFDRFNQAKLDEIISLAKSAGAEYYGYCSQQIREINPAYFIGKGKVEKIKEDIENSPVNLVIFDGELSPSQTLNLSEALGDIKVIDRLTLILDIFALNAATSEGKLQVELAQLKYSYPRLKGKGAALSGLGAGIGSRGPGETKLETDRRLIRKKINFLENELKSLAERRNLQRTRRKKNNVKTVALVGYTNVGKSTLFNLLTGAEVLVKDKLFATLDPTYKKIVLEDYEAVLIDTVGFISDIPHSLIESFKSTLETAVYADLILIVADATGSFKEMIETTEKTLEEIGAKSPKILVFNKCENITDYSEFDKNAVFISAKYNLGIQNLLNKINEFFKNSSISLKKIVPYELYGKFTKLESYCIVKKREYKNDGVYIEISIPKENESKFFEFI